MKTDEAQVCPLSTVDACTFPMRLPSICIISLDLRDSLRRQVEPVSSFLRLEKTDSEEDPFLGSYHIARVQSMPATWKPPCCTCSRSPVILTTPLGVRYCYSHYFPKEIDELELEPRIVHEQPFFLLCHITEVAWLFFLLPLIAYILEVHSDKLSLKISFLYF